MSEVTQILEEIDGGDARAGDRLFPLVYDELRRLAGAYLENEKPGQTLQPTALVHEAFLRLVGENPGTHRHFTDSRHFLAAAALAMRHILIDKARRKKRDKHGGDRRRVELPEVPDPYQAEAEGLLALDDALTRLAASDSVAAELVQLHTFGGLSVEEAGRHLGLSRPAAYRQWAFARAWLRCELVDSPKNS